MTSVHYLLAEIFSNFVVASCEPKSVSGRSNQEGRIFLGGGRDRDGKKLGTNKYFQFESQLNISEIATLLQKMSSLD